MRLSEPLGSLCIGVGISLGILVTLPGCAGTVTCADAFCAGSLDEEGYPTEATCPEDDTDPYVILCSKIGTDCVVHNSDGLRNCGCRLQNGKCGCIPF